MQLLVTNNTDGPLFYSVVIKDHPRVQAPSVAILPGVNEVDAVEFRRGTDESAEWKWRIANGKVEVKEKPDSAGEGIGHLSASEAKKLIENTFRVELLESWEHAEKRGPVARALRERAKFLANEFAKRPHLEGDNAE